MITPKSFLDDPFITAKDIIEITGLKKLTVYQKIRREMKHYRFGRRVVVRHSDFEKWLETRMVEPSSY